MIRIRSPTKKKLNSKSISDWKSNTSGRFFYWIEKEKFKKMKQEMINVNANLVAEPTFSNFEKDGETVEVANFTLVKKYGKGKEYINCAAYGEKAEKAKDFEKGDLIHIFGYFKKREKEGKTYKNFVVKSYNKIEKKEENEEE